MEVRQLPAILQREKNLHSDKRAEHENLAVRKINELQHAVNHRVSQGDQGIHKTKDDAVQEHLRQDFERKFQFGSDP